MSISQFASSEEIALFNPAFLSVLTYDATSDFQKSASNPLPVVLPYLILPLALHRPTREDLPSTVAAQMQNWIQEHPRHLVDLDRRVVGLKPFVSASLRLALTHGVLTTERGRLMTGRLARRRRGAPETESDEVAACRRTARFCGRWFARQPDVGTLLALWGLRP